MQIYMIDPYKNRVVWYFYFIKFEILPFFKIVEFLVFYFIYLIEIFKDAK
jgi:hypothetical protein